ncbi:MAG: hypothetical protein WC454_08775 [Phycisphaerae bacterium]|jgi:hypothetical protein
MNRNKNIRLLSFFVILLLTCQVCFGQELDKKQGKITFYGKVVDQFSNPVAGIEIK